jgi:Uncharacterized protein conserved in bacteria
MNYYGDKISENMVMTPEGYLVCENVPIGRTGYMEYLGRELPAAFNEPTGEIFKVYRRPEELFSEATIASFEGKPITNTHPTANLNVDTAPMIERGHTQNVRREGDFLVADLHVKDAGLISEIQNKLKREVSSGYDCSWHKIGEGVYEQREIIGNHVAVVQNGRAGPKVAIHDSKPNKPNTGGKKMKITQKMLAAIGFKHFAQDADPEDIAKAMDALNEEEEEKKEPVKDTEPEEKKEQEPEKKEAKDEMPVWAQQLISEVRALKTEVKDSKPEDNKETAESIMDATEEELEKEPAKDEDPEEKKESEKKEETKDEDPEPEKKGAADAALKKFVQDMKPIIMAIPDEKTRLEAAKKFRATVQDARSYRAVNGYGNILGTVAANKKAAMDSYTVQRQSVAEQTEIACKKWSEAGQNMRGGN